MKFSIRFLATLTVIAALAIATFAQHAEIVHLRTENQHLNAEKARLALMVAAEQHRKDKFAESLDSTRRNWKQRTMSTGLLGAPAELPFSRPYQ